MKKKRFVCIFPIGENIHLIKDVGMIPYHLYKTNKFESYISFYEEENLLPFLKERIPGVKYHRIKRLLKSDLFNQFIFLLTYFKRYDIVMMFHPSSFKLLIALFIKIISFNRVKFYFKMDLSSNTIIPSKGEISFRFRLFSWLCSIMEMVSVETSNIASQINRLGVFQVSYIPNGFSKFETTHLSKEDIFLTVGRLGTLQKNTERLLSAFKLANPKNYKLYLIGSVEPEFENYIRKYFIENPHLLEKVRFLGSINDNNELSSYYSRSRIFILPSRWEGFPLVYPEAIAHGCFIVGSAFPATIDISGDGRFGAICSMDSVEDLALIMQRIDEGQILLPASEDIQNFAFQNFRWEDIVNRIAERFS
ncbi:MULTISPECIES: glycosyltransferase family 4 protein [Sphingobacterium]|uniref:glycosyltransferase family 4 protein n=1 Tax=Sphingobacterium TaxID=28453 RepID=UPI00257F63EF|nr:MULTISPECIES: glycosyltransferase family 4 protein [Sphingobacterium]